MSAPPPEMPALAFIATSYHRGSSGDPTDASEEFDSQTVLRDADRLFHAASTEPSDTERFALRALAVRRVMGVDAGPAGQPGDLIALLGEAGAAPGAARPCVLAAFASLDARDRVLWWFIATAGALPTVLADRLGISDADRVAGLVRRARSRLEHAYTVCRRERSATGDAPDDVGLAAELHGLPAALTAEFARLDARLGSARSTDPTDAPDTTATTSAAATTSVTAAVATSADYTVGAPATAPLLISTTPPIEPAAVGGSAHEVQPSDPNGPARWRRRSVIMGAGAVAVAVAVAFAAWAATRPGGNPPVDAGTARTVTPSTSVSSPTTSRPPVTSPAATTAPEVATTLLSAPEPSRAEATTPRASVPARPAVPYRPPAPTTVSPPASPTTAAATTPATTPPEVTTPPTAPPSTAAEPIGP